MRDVHLITLFSRHHLFAELVSCYRSMRVFWHLLRFEGEEPFPPQVMDELWIKPLVIPDAFKIKYMIPANNYFLQNVPIVDEDYYVLCPDDDMYEPGVMRKIKAMDDDVVIISMKRGHHPVREATSPHGPHGIDTLVACPENMQIGRVGGEQTFVKGKIFKKHPFRTDVYESDGWMCLEYQKHYKIRFEPNLFVMFNYYQPGRWDK